MTNYKALGFMAGLGFGAGMALLFAPQSGTRTRLMLSRKTRKGTKFFKSQATALRDSATELVNKGQQHKEGLKRAVELGKRAYRDTVG